MKMTETESPRTYVLTHIYMGLEEEEEEAER